MKKPGKIGKERNQKESRKPWDAEKEERFGHRRKINTNFLFWTVCEDKACARARGCAGAEPDACFDRWWPAVPDEMKVQLRAYAVGAGAKGMSREEALAYAQNEVARWKADEALCAQMIEEHSAPAIAREPANAPKSEPVTGPCVRSL